MKKFLLTLMGVICSLGMWADTTVIYNDGSTLAKSVTLKNGFTISIGADNKSWANGGGKVTIDGTEYQTLKNSNGAQNTLTAPEGYNITGVTFYVTANADGDAVLKEFEGQTTTDAVTSHKDYTNPTVIAKTLATPANSVTFNFSTKQVCFAAVVTYEASSEKSQSDLAVSSTASVDINKTTSVTYTTSSTGDVSVASSAEDVATATVDAATKTVTISGVAEGTATITLSQAADDNYFAGSKTITVTVTDPTKPSVVYNWNTVGTTTLYEKETGKGASAGQVKIKGTSTDGIKLAGSLSADAYAKIESNNGGFKAGDVIYWTGCVSNKDNTKDGAIMIATAEANGFRILDASAKFNNTYDGTTEASTGSFTLPYDVEALYIGRTNKADYLSNPTATWLTALKVERPLVAPTTYAINITASENGTVTAPATAAMEGAYVEVKATADEGYSLSTLTANGDDIKETKSFTMPASDVTVSATFTSTPTAINSVAASAKANNGIIKTANYIIKNGKKYNFAGQLMK